ncbi:MAG: hypothetical protein AAGI22_20455 [Planctomycetota bacterium]
MRHLSHRAPHLLALAALAPTVAPSLAAALPAQVDDAHVLIREGTPLSNGETALFFGDYRVENNGSWAAVIGTDGPAVLGFGREVLLRDGNVVLAEGDALPSGAVIHAIEGMELDPNGEILAQLSILPPGAAQRIDAIWFNGITILRAGPLIGTGVPSGAMLDEIYEFEVGRQNELLVAGRASLSPTGGRDVVLRLDYSSGLPAITVEALSDTPIAPFTDPIGSIPEFARSFDAVSDGSFVLPIDLDRGALPVKAGVASGVATYEDDAPAPLPNFIWDLIERPSMCAGLGGTYAVGGRTRTTFNLERRGILVKSGAVVAREGLTLNGTSNLVVRQFLQPTIDMAETGELFFQLPVRASSTDLEVMMVDTEILIRTGTSKASGEIIESFAGQQDSLRVSRDGIHCLFHAKLPGNVEVICALERQVGGAIPCTSAPNSTGQRGQLRATGSSFIAVDELELIASQLPPDSFGFLCLSRTPGFIANPGGSVGNLCLGGQIGRFVGQVQSSGPAGTITTVVDLAALPQPQGSVPAQVGEIWGFQMWHRDGGPSGPVSNWTDPWAVRFR